MISIIISSRNQEHCNKIKSNIAATIGEAFEIIIIKNNGDCSLSKVYNEGGKLANYPYICFVHDDVIFQTNNWGKKIINIFQDNKIGLVGVVGSKILTRYSLGWFCPFFSSNFLVGHIIQGNNSFDDFESIYYSQSTENLEKVVVIDGVFMFTTKDIWERAKFDEKKLFGFHAYDVDFCLNIIKLGFEIVVDKEISLLHKSTGVNDKKWFDAICSINKKYKNILPVITEDLKINWIKYFKTRILLFLRYIKKYFEYNLKNR